MSAEPIVKIIYVECLYHLLGPKKAFDWLSSQEAVKDDNEIRLNLASLAVKNRDFDYALTILDSLIAKPHPGPYPYLLKAEVYANQIAPPETIVLTTGEEIELRKNAKKIVDAINNLERGTALLETAGRSLEIPPHANTLSELYIAKGDLRSAERTLRTNWKTLRKTGNAWFTASSIAFFKGKREKALARSQKALKLYKQNDKEARFRFALSCMNIQEWDRCLTAINSIPSETLDTEELKAALEIKVVCYFHKKQADVAAENMKALREKFPSDESWVILEGVMRKESGHLDQAIELLREKSKEFPNSVRIKVQLAAFYREAKRYNEGCSVYAEVARGLQTTRAYEEACAVGLYAQIPKDVLSLITEAEKNSLTSERLTHFEVIALAMNKEYEKAHELFSKFPEESLSSDDYLFYSLSVENKLNAEEAIRLLNRAKLKYPKDTRIIRSLCSLYVERNDMNKAFQEARLWLELDRTDKAPHFAVIMTGFVSGEQEVAHKTLMEYLSVFGEGPELRSGSIEDIKKHIKMVSQRSELLWEKYQAGQMPEAILATEANLGLGGYRIELLKSSGRVMAFNGNSEAQKQCFFDSSTAKEVAVDYHGLITMYLLGIIEPTISLFGSITIPEVVFEKIREDLSELSLSIQQDKRRIKEGAFSTVKSMFRIYEKLPQIIIAEIPPTVGNSIYDVLVCKETGSVYVTPGFENQDGRVEKESLGVHSISVLDFIAVMKEAGAISVRQYEKASTILEKYRLKSLSGTNVAPSKALFDWNTLEMLEECGLLADVPSFVKDCGVGPFSYALLRSDIERYRRIDEIQDILRKIEAVLKDLLERGVCKEVIFAGREKEGEEIPAKQKRAIKYIDTVEGVCSERHCLLWTDDLATSTLATNRGMKYTSSRTMLDVLAQKGLVSEEDYVEKLIQLLKWGMYFCWINVDMIAKSSQMYSYSKSDDVMLVFKSLTAEIEGYLNHVPNEVEVNNFNVASRVMKQLWLISEKAQSLGMELFDQVLWAIGKKELLRQYWIMVSILNMSLVGEVPLSEFLTRLSFRMPSQIDDELKTYVKKFIEICLKGESRDVIRVSGKRVKIRTLIRAVQMAIPMYRDELVKFAVDLDPSMRAIL
jgi:tetratricopeptide (TPR) repeat protein